MALKAARVRAIVERSEEPQHVVTEAQVVQSRKLVGASFRDHLLRKFASGLWNARDVCETAYFATKAGATGVEDLVVNPKSLKIAHSHLDMVVNELGCTPNLITIDCPIYEKRTSFRSSEAIPFRPAHASLVEAYAAGPPALDTWWRNAVSFVCGVSFLGTFDSAKQGPC